MSKRNPCIAVFANSIIARLLLAVILFSFAPSLLRAQTAATNPEVQALREEVNELKARLAGLESKLEALGLATAPAANRVTAAVPLAPAVEQSSSKPVPAVEQTEAQPASAAQVAPKPAPFAF